MSCSLPSINEGFSSKYWSKIYLCIQGGKVDNTPVPVDGFDVWETVSFGKPSPRTEILLNIDLKSEEKDNKINSDPFYQGAAIRVGDMKLLMSCPNSTWFKPPERSNVAVFNDKVSILQELMTVFLLTYESGREVESCPSTLNSVWQSILSICRHFTMKVWSKLLSTTLPLTPTSTMTLAISYRRRYKGCKEDLSFTKRPLLRLWTSLQTTKLGMWPGRMEFGHLGEARRWNPQRSFSVVDK